MRKEIAEKKNDLIAEAEKIGETAKTEKRELTDEEMKRVREIKAEVDAINERAAAEDEIFELGKEKVDSKKSEEHHRDDGGKAEKDENGIDPHERAAFENYIRGFVAHERAGELTPSTNPKSGGALIPTTIVNYIIRKVYDICPILERSQKFNVKGKLDVPFYPADSNKINVAYATEFTALTSSSGAFDTVELSGFLAGALTKISRSLINNVDFDLTGFVVDEMAYAIKRFIEHECLVGTSGKVAGLSTLTNGITAAATNAITADELIQLRDSIKDEFQQNAIWIMSPATRTACRLLKDNMDRYLLQDDISLPFGTSILGKPVYVSDNMPDIAAGKDVIYYGDFRGLATKFSEDINIEVLRERFADEHCIACIGWLEFDSAVIDEQQLAKLTMKAS